MWGAGDLLLLVREPRVLSRGECYSLSGWTQISKTWGPGAWSTCSIWPISLCVVGKCPYKSAYLVSLEKLEDWQVWAQSPALASVLSSPGRAGPDDFPSRLHSHPLPAWPWRLLCLESKFVVGFMNSQHLLSSSLSWPNECTGTLKNSFLWVKWKQLVHIELFIEFAEAGCVLI